MTDSFTTRKVILKQGAGDGVNIWGDRQGTGDFDVIDFALDGWSVIALAADHVLTRANGTTTGNEAGARALKLTTASATYTTTMPAVEGWYLVWNATTAAQTVASSGGGTSVSIGVGEKVFVACDATNVIRLTLTTMTAALDMGSNKITSVTDPTNPQDAATKAYADNLAFTANAGVLPGQVGQTSGNILKTNGSVAAWTNPKIRNVFHDKRLF